ncbi:Bem46 protein (plasmid) [Legionella adelaidensis]|uniref:2-hydroxy-6-oxononadienedioate/2-hydroxy-6-oxononatrienedioate hydrolase n=1 Tax=Legionella adelaidensis TaxID=45056 RepID=A0A0W0R148_9GAMM|nr:alpha/beta fold hydrolase [Legionella adelaidensis]KTC64749.1 2-hydroxy-6-oxononadienedioate/2-hydroxy-6-oxononatrienedioate hydrolase [Legionella adelaidensis]VEH81299.1 Bem46 protein [Legionella adelaidensis]
MIKHLIVITVLFFLFVFVFIYFWQRHLIYFPAKGPIPLQEFTASDMQEITLKTKDGLNLLAWYKPAVENKPTILYFHGNAGNIGYRMPLVRKFLEAGYGVLLLEYRGYGPNEGSPTELGLYADGRAAISFLHQHGIEGQKIVFFGESLGTGVAVQLANEYPVCALVLQSPYTSFTDLARYHYPWVWIKPRDRYESLDKMAHIKAALLILHGKMDQIVPFSQGWQMYNKANEPKKLAAFSYAGHNNLWQMPDFVPQVINFLTSYCK